MNKKLISSLVAGLALSAAAVAPAQASVMSDLSAYAGPLYFDIVGADQGSIYQASCTTAATCDGAALLAGAAGAIGSEDSWGIFRVKGIYADALQNTAVWVQSATDYLIGSFGGLIDQSVKMNLDGSQTAYSSGGGLRMWETNTNAGYLAALASGGVRDGLGNVAGVDGVGALIMQANFVGTAASSIVGNYQNTYTASTRVLSGNGYLDVVGGAALGLIGNSFVVDGDFVTQDVSLSTVNNPNNQAVPKWLTGFGGTAIANDIPEPGSMALVGLGLMGLAGLRRRKQQA